MNKAATLPQHIAIIMDGNGRWAKKRGLPRVAGHKAGADTVDRITTAAREMGVKVLTLYAFSTENWKRPKDEVSALFDLLGAYLDKEADKLRKNDIQLRVIGRVEELPATVRAKIVKVMECTKHNTGLILTLALNYGGRSEIVDAARAIAKDVREGRVAVESIDEKLFARYLYTRDLPDPDLLIRTSGEFRISNFLLWQLSYAELYITETLWPDFTADDFRKALEMYQKRERRFGG